MKVILSRSILGHHIPRENGLCRDKVSLSVICSEFMTRAFSLLLALLIIAVPLAGCTGDDTELNAANDRISEFETQAEVDQDRIAELESEAEADEAAYQKLMDDLIKASKKTQKIFETEVLKLRKELADRLAAEEAARQKALEEEVARLKAEEEAKLATEFAAEGEAEE